MRHCTHGLLHFLVRLACVRHAASVDSEPGSNSHLYPDHFCDEPESPPRSICSSRSNLNPSYLHNTTGTFNLIVKDQTAFRLSGAFQSSFACPLSSSFQTVLETFLTYRPIRVTVNLWILWKLRISTQAIRAGRPRPTITGSTANWSVRQSSI